MHLRIPLAFLFVFCLPGTGWPQLVNVDPTYGSGGVRTVHFGNTFEASVTSTRQPDGKLVLVGTVGSGDQRRISLARIDANGNLDPSFGGSGKVILTYDTLWSHIPRQAFVDPDGKILVVFALNENNQSTRMIARLLPNGQPDPGFGNQGYYKSPFPGGETWSGVHRQADGKYMCFGSSSVIFDGTFYGRVVSFRLMPDGKMDTSYNGSNYRIHRLRSIDLTRESPVYSAQSPNGGFALYCSAQNPVTSTTEPFLVRVKANGDFDSTFAGTGKEPIAFPGVTTGVLGIQMDAQNRIKMPGIYRANATAVQSPTIYGFRATGGFDPGFGTNGLARIVLPNEAGFNTFIGTDLVRDEQNRWYLSFAGWSLLSTSRVFAVARFTPEGQPDPGFSPEGYVATNLPGNPQKIYLAADGWPIVTGQTNLGSVAINDDLVAVKIRPTTTSVPEPVLSGGLYPNPVAAGTEVALPFGPRADLVLIDVRGRSIPLEGHLLLTEGNTVRLQTGFLKPGLYRIGHRERMLPFWVK